MMRLLLGVCLIGGSLLLNAQNIDYAREVINELCTPNMAGRGYIDGGDAKAAEFIQEEFKRLKVKKIGNTYFQNFFIDANIFPGKMEMSINGKPLRAGKDFLIDPASTGIEGEYEVITLTKKHLLKDASFEDLLKRDFAGKVLTFKYKPKHAEYMQGKLALLKSNAKAAAYLNKLDDNRLSWHITGQPKYQTEIDILAKATPKKIKTVRFNIESDYLSEYKTKNVIGYIKGYREPDKYVFITAHYDHLGEMGAGNYLPGANDNASGVAMLLNLADYYSKNPPYYSIVFVAFGGEELGLMGSRKYVENPRVRLSDIHFLINLDSVGTGENGIGVVNATEFPAAFQVLQSVNQQNNYIKTIKARGTAANSDHWPFYEQGVSCFYMYTMGDNTAYHDLLDRPENLSLAAFPNMVRLITDFISAYKK